MYIILTMNPSVKVLFWEGLEEYVTDCDQPTYD